MTTDMILYIRWHHCHFHFKQNFVTELWYKSGFPVISAARYEFPDIAYKLWGRFNSIHTIKQTFLLAQIDDLVIACIRLQKSDSSTILTKKDMIPCSFCPILQNLSSVFILQAFSKSSNYAKLVTPRKHLRRIGLNVVLVCAHTSYPSLDEFIFLFIQKFFLICQLVAMHHEVKWGWDI